MLRLAARSFGGNESGAISPLYAVAILVLVAMAGIGFDYGRLMALDTELQNAADQAALAAATQLNGEDDAMERARDAANSTFASTASPYVNETRFANDSGGRPITSLSFRFFDGYADDTMGTEVTDDADGADARVVEVTVNAREVFYALTPLIGAFSSGDVRGRALAGLDEATCNVAPVFFCVPNDSSGNPIRTFPTLDNVGDGLELHFKQNQTGNDTDDGGTSWAPGNFGFLDVPWGTGSQKTRRLGLNTAVAGCFRGNPASRTGFKDPEGDALNTRLDLYNAPLQPNSCDADGNYCPAENVRKDWVRKESFNNVPPAQINSKTCSSSGPGTWMTEDAARAEATTFDPTGPSYPEDNCFTSATCNVNGNGTWDSSGTWSTQNLGVAQSSIPDLDGNGRISRWEAYQYELDNPQSAKKVGSKSTLRSNGNYNLDLYCSYPQPVRAPPGIPASDTQKDRRLLTAAAVDCTELNGKKVVDILQWVDLFLVRGVSTKGSDKVFFMEIKGPGEKPNGGTGFQYFGRKRAVLIR